VVLPAVQTPCGLQVIKDFEVCVRSCLTSIYSALYANPPHLNVSGEYPAHTAVSLAHTNMCIDRVAVLHSLHMTCTIILMYVSGDRCTLFTVQNGPTPLMIASSNGHVDVVRALIEAHADIHSQDKVWYYGILANHLSL